MVGNKRKRTRLLSAAFKDDKQTAVENEQNVQETDSWSDLPPELLEVILSRLSLKENIRVSCVCKRWHTVALSVRRMNKPPWIMYFPKSGNLYQFYDPLTRTTYSIKLPELDGSRVCYAKGGWLLLYRSRSHCISFFNPFTQELIILPRFEITHHLVAFSCDPTSPNCVIFTVKFVNSIVVAISTCHPGSTEWTTSNYQNHLPFIRSISNKLVFSNGQFYVLGLTGWLGVFNPKGLTWNVLELPPPRLPDKFFTKNWWKGYFLVEHDGDILAIYTCRKVHPMVFKLDTVNMVWEEVKTLDGVTLFPSFLSSHSRTNLPEVMRDGVYFSKVRYYGKWCISYSLKDCRYYPRKQFHDFGEQDPFVSVWIDPPQDLSIFP